MAELVVDQSEMSAVFRESLTEGRGRSLPVSSTHFRLPLPSINERMTYDDAPDVTGKIGPKYEMPLGALNDDRGWPG